jgi:hypothetical protein
LDCAITLSLLSESLTGNIGEDWEYSVEARVFNPELTGTGVVNVPEHKLSPGATQPIPESIESIVLPAGPCNTGPVVELILQAREIDWLIDDNGSNLIRVPVECPGPGGPSSIIEPEISVRVREVPSIRGRFASLRVRVRLVAESVQTSLTPSPLPLEASAQT